MALSDKSKRVNVIFTDREFADPAVAMEFKGRLLQYGLPSVDCSQYAFILHDLDLRKEDKIDALGNVVWRKGELKTPHFHLWFESRVSRRLGTIISKLSQATGVDAQLISAERAVSMEGSIQYLIHKNDPDKHQYSMVEVMTNIPKDELALIMERDSSPFSVDFIMVSWENCRNMSEFVKAIGIERFNMYFKTISALTNGFRK